MPIGAIRLSRNGRTVIRKSGEKYLQGEWRLRRNFLLVSARKPFFLAWRVGRRGSWHPPGGLAKSVPPCARSIAIRISGICPVRKGFGKTARLLPPKFRVASGRSPVPRGKSVHEARLRTCGKESRSVSAHRGPPRNCQIPWERRELLFCSGRQELRGSAASNFCLH